MRNKLLFIIILLNNLLLAQKEVVEILSANELKPGRTDDHQKLVGNVILKFDDTKLFCDSAEVNGKTHDFNAWGEVYINQNNTTKAWGDSLIYDGSRKVGKLSGDVKMKSEKLLIEFRSWRQETGQ
jgi:lipopolysaccharide export system protein LptA